MSGYPFDEDSEVRADIELRARTERTRRSKGLPSWSPPVFVANWPCRVCRANVPITREGVDHFEMFNRMLSRRGEPLLQTTEIMYCDSCRAEFIRTAAERRRAQIERMRPLVQRLKRSANPEAERAIIEQLTQWGHPDVTGLVQAIRDRITSKGKREAKGEV